MIWCFCHRFNLIIKEISKNLIFIELLNIIKAIISFFDSSIKLNNIFTKHLTEANQKYNINYENIRNWPETRWQCLNDVRT